MVGFPQRTPPSRVLGHLQEGPYPERPSSSWRPLERALRLRPLKTPRSSSPSDHHCPDSPCNLIKGAPPSTGSPSFLRSYLPASPEESTCILVGFHTSASARQCQLWPPEGAVGGGRSYRGLSYLSRASPPLLLSPEVGGVARGTALDPSPRGPAAPSPRSARSGASRPSPTSLPRARRQRGVRGGRAGGGLRRRGGSGGGGRGGCREDAGGGPGLEVERGLASGSVGRGEGAEGLWLAGAASLSSLLAEGGRVHSVLLTPIVPFASPLPLPPRSRSIPEAPSRCLAGGRPRVTMRSFPWHV